MADNARDDEISSNDPSTFRVPSRHEKVKIQGLVSASQFNGCHGTVLKFLSDGRYKVKLADADKTVADKILSVKPCNLELSRESPTFLKWPVMHVFVPCHLTDRRRLDLFHECAKSLGIQDAPCCIFISISSCRNDDQNLQEGALQIIRILATSISRNAWYVVEQQETKSQFEHLQALHKVSVVLDSQAWLMFLDNDDMYHPSRVKSFRLLVESLESVQDVQAFWCGGKLLLDSEQLGDQVVSLERILKFDDSLDTFITVAATPKETDELTVLEYFDYCVKTCVLTKFLELTPPEILAHELCDSRFVSSLLRTCRESYTPRNEWLLVHYRLRHCVRHQAFLDDDVHKYSNASIHVTISDADMELASMLGINPSKVAYIRKDIEGTMVQWVARNEPYLEVARAQSLPPIDEVLGNVNLTPILWEQTYKRFSSFFSEDLANENRIWFEAGEVPYPVGMDPILDSDDAY